MPGDVLTRVEGNDAGAMSELVTEFLNIVDPGSAQAEAAAPAEADGMLEYGKGLGKYGAKYAQVSLPRLLRETVQASPPTMISADLWGKLPAAFTEAEERAGSAVDKAEADVLEAQQLVARLKAEVANLPAQNQPATDTSAATTTATTDAAQQKATGAKGKARPRNAMAMQLDLGSAALAGADTPQERLSVAEGNLKSRRSELATAKQQAADMQRNPDLKAMALL
jgi:hypothetical protein